MTPIDSPDGRLPPARSIVGLRGPYGLAVAAPLAWLESEPAWSIADLK